MSVTSIEYQTENRTPLPSKDFETEGHGLSQLPLSLLKQAMASPKIQNTIHDIEEKIDLPFADGAPSLEMMLEEEILAAYDKLNNEVKSPPSNYDDLLLITALETEAACQAFVEGALVDHLEKVLEKAEANNQRDIKSKPRVQSSEKTPNYNLTRKSPENLVPDDRPISQPEYLQEPDQSDFPSIRRRGASKLTRALVVISLLATPALVFGLLLKYSDPDMFASITQTVARKGVEIVSLATGDLPKNFSDNDVDSGSNSNVVMANVSSLAPADGDENTIKPVVMNQIVEKPDALAKIEAMGSEPEQQVAVVSLLDQTSILNSRLKDSKVSLARLEKLLANPNQQKKEDLQALIKDKQDLIGKLSALVERNARLELEPAGPQEIHGKQWTVAVSEAAALLSTTAASAATLDVNNTQLVRFIAPAVMEPKPDIANIQLAFQNSISIQQLSREEQELLAKNLGEGECLLPAVSKSLNTVPSLVLRDLVRALPDHC